MLNYLSRTEMLLGTEAVNTLKASSVIVFGAGGVGSYTVEALARCGVGHIAVCDADTVSQTNINRQLIATVSNVGRKKTDVIKERILDINPTALVETFDFFYDSESSYKIDLSRYDFIVDAIDSMDSKVFLISEAHRLNIKCVSALSAGNKLDPTRFETSDIFSTTVCPIAKILRKRLKEIGITSHKVVYSKEPPSELYKIDVDDNGKRCVGSISFVPSVMGLILAKETVFGLIERE